MSKRRRIRKRSVELLIAFEFICDCCGTRQFVSAEPGGSQGSIEVSYEPDSVKCQLCQEMFHV